MKNKTKVWFKAAGIRAIKTMAQTAVATIGVAAVMQDVNWLANRITLTSSDFHNTESQFFAATVQIHSRKVPVSVPPKSAAASQSY